MEVKPLNQPKGISKFNTKENSRYFQFLENASLVIVLFLFTSAIGLHFLYKNCQFNKHEADRQGKPRYWTYVNGNVSNLSVETMVTVLNRLGLERVNGDTLKDDGWDLLWSYNYPFHVLNLTDLKPHQKVNHYPGNRYLVIKALLATYTDSPYVPKAFRDIISFQKFTSENPEKRFVQKHMHNRGVSLKETDQIKFEDKNFFVQEFVENPLLIDGHFFDFGVYVVITSINPLRVYSFQGDIMLRFCPEKYHPFNASNVDQYVISDSMIFPWNIPSINKFYEKKYSAKNSLNAHIESMGYNSEDVWYNIENCISSVISMKEQYMVNEVKKFKSKDNFFELFRFDFMLDHQLNPYLLEINMGPNLTADEKRIPLKHLYAQVAYNVFNLVGVGSYLSRDTFKIRDYEAEMMMSSKQNLMVDAILCDTCDEKSCNMSGCEICPSCLDSTDLYELHKIYREHMHKGNFKRLLPSSIIDDENFLRMSPKNQKLTMWVQEKCVEDESWC